LLTGNEVGNGGFRPCSSVRPCRDRTKKWIARWIDKKKRPVVEQSLEVIGRYMSDLESRYPRKTTGREA
jgi:hypothetical protein